MFFMYFVNMKVELPEIIDPVFAKTCPKRSFCMTENERFGLVFVKIGSINSGKVLIHRHIKIHIIKNTSIRDKSNYFKKYPGIWSFFATDLYPMF